MPCGPCNTCGATNYAMSMGGPYICPSCDCGGHTQSLHQLSNQKEQAFMNAKADTVSTHKAPENGKAPNAIAQASTATAAPTPSTPTTVTRPPKPNRQILKHLRGIHKLEMQSTTRTLAHVAEAIACTSDGSYRAALEGFRESVNVFRGRLEADLKAAEGT